MSQTQYTYYVIILGGVRSMIILITQGWVQNWAKVDFVICARSLIVIEIDSINKEDPVDHVDQVYKILVNQS